MPTFTLTRLAAVVTGSAIFVGAALVAATPAYGAPLPQGTYEATVVPYLSTVTGHVTLTHGDRWIATAQLRGLTRGDRYQYEVSIASNYLHGQAHSFRTVALCSFVATSTAGSCGAAGVPLDLDTLTPQSSAFVFSPQAHSAVAAGDYSYQAVLSPYDELSNGGQATLGYDGGARWSGHAEVSGLTPGTTYSWAVDVAVAYHDGEPVGFHRVVLCQFVAATSARSACKADRVKVQGRTNLPAGSFSDVTGPVTSVATGVLY